MAQGKIPRIMKTLEWKPKFFYGQQGKSLLSKLIFYLHLKNEQELDRD